MNINGNLNFLSKVDSSLNNSILSNGLLLPQVQNSIKTKGSLSYNPQTNTLELYNGTSFVDQSNLNVTFVNTTGLILNPNISNQFVLVDSSNISVTLTLPDAHNPGVVIEFSLLTENSLPVTVILQRGGTFILTSSFPQKTLIYTTDMGWIPYLNSLNYDYFVSRQEAELIGTGGVQPTFQGTSVAISADGDTVAIGGFNQDGGSVGQTWVFVRNASLGTWTQQTTPLLVGTGAVGNSSQGISLSLSSDGNTLAIGGYNDNGGIGATWIFTRNTSSGVWKQQGNKLVGTGNVGGSNQGTSISLSADGNTLAVGGPSDNGGIGAVWIFVRNVNLGTWSQQDTKLIGTGNTAGSTQGFSVSLSANGNILALGGPFDNGGDPGSIWIFTRSGGVWTQLNAKLTGTGGVDQSVIGESISLSADGSILVAGGPGDNNGSGAVWTWYFNSAANAYQQISKISGDDGNFGTSVSLSSDGNTLAVGIPEDNNGAGSVAVYTKSTGNEPWGQGNVIIPTGAIFGDDGSNVGCSCAFSSYGTTLIVGGNVDNLGTGASWIII